MHRRPLHKQHGGLWEFPGGKVEDGEAPEIAMVRELDEELGIAVDAADLVPAAFAEDRGCSVRAGIVILLYTIAAWRGDPVARETGAQVDWFLPIDIAKLDRPPLDISLAAQLFGFASVGEGVR